MIASGVAALAAITLGIGWYTFDKVNKGVVQPAKDWQTISAEFKDKNQTYELNKLADFLAGVKENASKDLSLFLVGNYREAERKEAYRMVLEQMGWKRVLADASRDLGDANSWPLADIDPQKVKVDDSDDSDDEF
jgi:hypothetical protein